ncbi:MAG: hypothetical protein HRU20_28045 [Pseudomonadales bacterium]|nr:hypothetical protein [Pseudomonadales bacterium]
MGDGKTVRFLHVGEPEQTASYWFQSRASVTAEYSAQILNALFEPEKNGVMVSILLDDNSTQDVVAKLLALMQNSLGLQISSVNL